MYIIAGNMQSNLFPAKMYIIAEILKRKMYYIAGNVLPFRAVIDTPINLRLRARLFCGVEPWLVVKWRL